MLRNLTVRGNNTSSAQPFYIKLKNSRPYAVAINPLPEIPELDPRFGCTAHRVITRLRTETGNASQGLKDWEQRRYT